MAEKEYCITDGKRYVKSDVSGVYKTTSNICIADTFVSQKSAQNILANCIPKALANTFYVAKIDGSNIIQCTLPRCCKTEKKSTNEKFEHKHTTNVCKKWQNCFSGMDSFFEEAGKRKKELPQELSDVEAEIVDVEHYIEFVLLNARDGYKMYKKLHQLLVKRREIKDELKIVSAITNNYSVKENISTIVGTINGCANASYTPRVLSSLFKEGVVSLKN